MDWMDHRLLLLLEHRSLSGANNITTNSQEDASMQYSVFGKGGVLSVQSLNLWVSWDKALTLSTVGEQNFVILNFPICQFKIHILCHILCHIASHTILKFAPFHAFILTETSNCNGFYINLVEFPQNGDSCAKEIGDCGGRCLWKNLPPHCL